MKSFAAVTLACLMVSTSAFTGPTLATRAIGNPFAKKKAAPPAPVKNAPPASTGYPSFASDAAKIKFNVSGGGNYAPPSPYKVPDFSDARLQIERDPAFYAEAAKTRKTAFSRNNEYVFEDGLTVIERDQRRTIPGFLSGSAKSQADKSTIRDDLEIDTLIFGLDPDRFQLLFIAVFGLFALIGGLSGNLNF
mmetsp:Transcript_13162/g.19196  ORF Transcript_13162/g.19196 Transcript_13162/m.19196 type:complete len:192 (-) Transcript_13162:243-818(-)